MKVEFEKVGDVERMTIDGDPREFPELFKVLLERYMKPAETLPVTVKLEGWDLPNGTIWCAEDAYRIMGHP